MTGEEKFLSDDHYLQPIIKDDPLLRLSFLSLAQYSTPHT